VLLDGQGGDELLCGYPGYWGSYLGDLLHTGAVGKFLHEAWAFGRRQNRIHPTVFANFARALLPVGVLARTRASLKGDSLWANPEFIARYRDRRELLTYQQNLPTAVANHTAAYLQTHSLPALLHHEDRNSMAFSIEARLPFLDARLLEFLVALPVRYKLRNGQSKFILRNATQGLLPEPVRLRSDKMGFATPQDQWLRKTWRSDLQELLSGTAFEQRGYWDAARMRNAYRDYCEGGNAIGSSIWRCVSVELWHQRFFQ
jgi:asparagine synthase (glutamine-hydrolysing)